jgi:hypothetical protein
MSPRAFGASSRTRESVGSNWHMSSPNSAADCSSGITEVAGSADSLGVEQDRAQLARLRHEVEPREPLPEMKGHAAAAEIPEPRLQPDFLGGAAQHGIHLVIGERLEVEDHLQ